MKLLAGFLLAQAILPMAHAASRPAVLFATPRGPVGGYLDLSYAAELCQRGFEVDYTDSLTDLTTERLATCNAVVIFILPEKREERTPLIERLRAHVDSGGGLFVWCGVESLHANQGIEELIQPWAGRVPAEVIDEPDVARAGLLTQASYNVKLAYTDQVLPSPVSHGVRGIWYPQGIGPILVSAAWQVVLRTSPAAVTKPDRWLDAIVRPEDRPFHRTEPAPQPDLFAVRTVGKGRVALLHQMRQFSVGSGTRFIFNREVLTRGLGDRPSDFQQLLDNTYRWLAEPSLAAGTPGGQVTNPERLRPPNAREEVVKHYRERSYPNYAREALAAPPTNPHWRLFRGVIGARTAAGGGSGDVAEYAALARELGLDFLVFLEDYRQLTPDAFARLKTACREHSTDTLRLFAGYTIETNLGNRAFFYGEDPQLPPPAVLRPDGRLNWQNQDAEGKFVMGGSLITWILEAWQVTGQAGFYNLRAAPRAMQLPDLRLYSMVGLLYYRDGKLVEDLTDDYLLTAAGTLPPSPASIIEATSPTALREALAAGCAPTWALARSLRQLLPDALRYAHQYDGLNVFPSTGPLIRAWPGCHRAGPLGGETFVTGMALMPSDLIVSAAAGIKELRLYNGTELYRRFLPGGAPEFRHRLMLDGTIQKNLVLVAEDMAGGKAVSAARRCWKESGRAVAFCSDHVNDCKSGNMLLGRGPNTMLMHYAPALAYDIGGYTWDGGPPPSLPLVNLAESRPEFTGEEATEPGNQFNQVPLLDFTDEGVVAVRSRGNEVFDPAVRAVNPWHSFGPKDPSRVFEYLASYWEYIQPTLGAPEVGWASPPVPDGGTCTLFRTTLTFKQPVTAKTVRLAYGWQQPRPADATVVGQASGVRIEPARIYELLKPLKLDLQPGDWLGVFSAETSSTHLFICRDTPLRLHVFNPKKQHHLWMQLFAPVEGRSFKPGDTWSYELFGVGFPVDVPITEAAQLERCVQYLREATGIELLRGERLPSHGLYDVRPADGRIELAAVPPPNSLNLTFPLRLVGLNRRWTAGLLQRQGYNKGFYGDGTNRWRALGIDADGNAWVPLYVSKAPRTWIEAGHPVVADDRGRELFIQVTHVTREPQVWHVSVNNPTDAPITTTVRAAIALPGLDLPPTEITVPPGGILDLR